jgi:hypothetical protein
MKSDDLEKWRNWFATSDGLFSISASRVPAHFDFEKFNEEKEDSEDWVFLDRGDVVIYLGQLELTKWDGPHVHVFGVNGLMWVSIYNLERL